MTYLNFSTSTPFPTRSYHGNQNLDANEGRISLIILLESQLATGKPLSPEEAERTAGDEMALKVEDVADGGMDRE